MVALYLPVTPVAVAAMMATARIGAVHSVIFAGFSSEAIASRINDAGASVVITADEAVRGGKKIPLKPTVDRALADCPNVKTVFVQQRTGGEVRMMGGRDVWLEEAMAGAATVCQPEVMEAEDPLFLLYTSGSTGKPKVQDIPNPKCISNSKHSKCPGSESQHGRLLAVCGRHPQARVRLPARRAVWLRGGYWLDHRAQLRGVRAPGQWRHHAPV